MTDLTTEQTLNWTEFQNIMIMTVVSEIKKNDLIKSYRQIYSVLELTPIIYNEGVKEVVVVIGEGHWELLMKKKNEAQDILMEATKVVSFTMERVTSAFALWGTLDNGWLSISGQDLKSLI